MKAFHADRNVVTCYTNGFVVEATMHFLRMQNINDPASKNIPPVFNDAVYQKTWVYQTIEKLVDLYIFPAWTEHDKQDGETTGNSHEINVGWVMFRCLGVATANVSVLASFILSLCVIKKLVLWSATRKTINY